MSVTVKKLECLDNDFIIVQLKAGIHYMTFKTHTHTETHGLLLGDA